MTGYQLAQINIGRLLAPRHSPLVADFVDQLDEMNALAERSPGFVWRLVDDAEPAAVAAHPELADEKFQLNCSVWESVEALWEYAFRSDHLRVLSRRREWFERPDGPHQALWWVPAGHRPTAAEAMGRIARLRDHGPGPDAFTFRDRHPAPEARAAGVRV
ncbi:DUF3291 domain-containing protein [Kitasatospora sp. CB01950]|uniref:DUF3291 domain-containing protein n=1 Tax=Kitasatospora sp. CB01950 TaxID=1703930 RepID=UPI00093A08DF|nr:DUF3291 domain-containing protein [Kitasatospora sp. CB01950]OKJ13596.1 hypothetical protein AMK19_09050 [Kitasatospora sp. CB01950]